MTRLQICARCGSALVRSARGTGLCARCLASGLFAAPTEEKAASGPLPRTFGAYDLLEEIGRGGMGAVYRAWQTALGRQVAVKLLLAGAYSSEAQLSRFRLEAAAAAGLQHPNIVPVHDCGECDGFPYYAMELVDGRNLAETCAGRPLEAGRAAVLLRELARAVHYAHQKGIVHRDLKPSNVLLDDQGQPRITDFGLARRLDGADGATVTGQMLGSPSYASPEQAAGRPGAIRVASDVYGLGALLYHLLTGRAPFNAATAAETLRLVLEAEPVAPHLLNPGLPRDLETICLKCLAKEPARRYPSAGAVADDCERFLGHRPIQARRPSWLYRLRKFVRRHRFGVMIATAGLLALVAGLVVALAGLRRAVVARNAANLARAQAEQLLTRLSDDLQPGLADRGGLKLLRASTEAAIRYYETLPPGLRDVKTEERHAAALESLMAIRKNAGDRAGLEEMWRAAAALRRRIVAEIPTDPDAAAELLKDEASAGSSLMAVIDDDRTQTDERVRREIIERWRQLRARFPDSPRVKLGLATELYEFARLTSGPWSGLYLPRDARLAAAEARPLVEELEAANPGYPGLRSLRWSAAQVQASVLLAAGESEKAIAGYEGLVAEIDAFVRENPSSLSARRMLALNLSVESFALSGISLQRAANLSRQARDQYRLLMRLDPTNQRYALEYSRTYTSECYDLAWRDGMLAPARQAFREWDAACEPFRESDARTRRERWWRSLVQASLAACADEPAEARDLIAEAKVRFGFYCDRLPDTPPARQRARIDFLPQLSWPLLYLHDWPELERASREHRDEVEAALQDRPADPELLINRLLALRFLGQALQRQGRLDEAVSVLERAVTGFRESPLTPAFSNAVSMRHDATECLAAALRQRGDRVRARALLEEVLAGRVAERDGWLQREAIARTLIGLGDTYSATDPTEREHRAELLDRAAAILNSPDAEGRITRDGREARATLVALRGSAAMTQ